MDLRNARVLITGGSKGLGRALAMRLAGAGARVAIVARGAKEVARTVAAIRVDGGVAHGIVDDVGDEDAAERIAGQAGAALGAVDILIHNASTLGPTPMPALAELRSDDLRRVLDVNVLGPLRLTQTLLGSMVLHGSGLVVAVSSDAAVEAYPGWGGYGISKAALDHLIRVWATELASSGVGFLSVDPGEMNTEMHAAAVPHADPTTLAQPGEVARRLVERIGAFSAADSGARVSVAVPS